MVAKSVSPTRIASNLSGAHIAAQKLDKGDISMLDGLAAGGKQKRYVFIRSSESVKF